MINKIAELVGDKQFEDAKILIDEELIKNPFDIDLLKLAGLTYINLDLNYKYI